MTAHIKTWSIARGLAAGLLVVGAVDGLDAQILSNGTGGGDWSSSSTWQGGTAPNNNLFNVLAADTVSATNVTYFSSSADPALFGTLNINSGSTFTVDRLNNGQNVAGGVLNINGGSFTASRLAGNGAAGAFTINVASGGAFAVTSLTNADTTININPGGTATLPSYLAVERLVGGTLINASQSSDCAPAYWNTGTYISNAAALNTGTNATNFTTAFSTNPANLLVLSNKSSRQTLSLGRDNQSLGFTASSGIIEFKVYSSTTNDNDLMTQQLLGGDFNLSSGVHLRIEDFAPLPGAAADYLNVAYKLFNDTNDYSDLQPTFDATVWNIGGSDYNVTFTNNLAVDGSVMVSQLTPVPEPGAVLLALLGLGACVLSPRRRSPEATPSAG